MRHIFLLATCMLVSEIGHLRAEVRPCETSLVEDISSDQVSPQTRNIIGYLGHLLEERAIKEAELQQVLGVIESSGRITNPISEEAAQLDPDNFIHRGGIQKLIDADGIDINFLKQWLWRTLEERGVARVEREETRHETQDSFQSMIFHDIQPGEFEMGEPGQTAHVILTKPFALMSTQVTQKMWSQVMKANPSEFVKGLNTISMEINGTPIKMQPDNPVEEVNWNDTQLFIAELNKLSAKGDELIMKLIPDHKTGDIYRLPTEAEWEFVVRARGAAKGSYHFGDNELQLGDYAWFKKNSDGTTHPVAEKQPLIIDGKKFYDLHGNVWEWVGDWFGVIEPGKTLVDPQGPGTGSDRRVIRGGSWDNIARNLRSANRGSGDPSDRDNDLGLRLARTRSNH